MNSHVGSSSLSNVPRSAAEDALVARLQAIPKGALARVAKLAGVDLPSLMRLKRGEQTNIRLQTLEKIAKGLGEPIGVMLGEGPAPARQERKPLMDERALRRLSKHLRAAAAELEHVVEADEQAG